MNKLKKDNKRMTFSSLKAIDLFYLVNSIDLIQ